MKKKVLCAIFFFNEKVGKEIKYTQICFFLKKKETKMINHKIINLVTYHSRLKEIRELCGKMNDYTVGIEKIQAEPGTFSHSRK